MKIAAYFQVNGIKVSNPEKPINPPVDSPSKSPTNWPNDPVLIGEKLKTLVKFNQELRDYLTNTLGQSAKQIGTQNNLGD